jgi:hypothetical protein
LVGLKKNSLIALILDERLNGGTNMKKNWRFAAVLLMVSFSFTLIACNLFGSKDSLSSNESSTGTTTSGIVSLNKVNFECLTSCNIEDQNVESGELATKPTDPIKEGYAFKGWYQNDEPFDFKTIINKDITLTPKWLELFKVTFINYDNTFIDEVIVEEGQTAQAPTTPVRLSDDKFNYVFKMWDQNLEQVKSNLTVRPIYEAKLNQFNVKFVDYDNSIIGSYDLSQDVKVYPTLLGSFGGITLSS